MSMLKNGSTVRVVQPILQGQIVRADTNGEQFGYVVNFKDADGNDHQRFFPQDQLEAVADEPVPAA